MGLIRSVLSLVSLVAVSYAGFWFWTQNPTLQDNILSFLHQQLHRDQQTILTERYSPENIIDQHKDRFAHQEPSVHTIFAPYLLLDVKYSDEEQKTCEGLLLWSMTDGEVVLDAKDWTLSHGYADCIQAQLSSSEFSIINALAKSEHCKLDVKLLRQSCDSSAEHFDATMEGCRRKKVVVVSGLQCRLHIASPHLTSVPVTYFPYTPLNRLGKINMLVPERFSKNQISTAAQNAFSEHFAIRDETKVYLPIYMIETQTALGSTEVTYWNSYNGKEMSPPSVIPVTVGQNGGGEFFSKWNFKKWVSPSTS